MGRLRIFSPFHGSDERITIAFNCWFGTTGS